MKKKLTIILLLTFAFGFLGAVYGNDNVTVYTNRSPPTTLIKEDGSGLTGFSVEVVQELKKRVGNTSKIHLVPWVRGYKNVKSKPNQAIFTGSRNAARENIHHWIIHLTTRRSVFYAKKGSNLTISSIEDAKKYRIGVLREGNREKYLKTRGFNRLQSINSEEQNIKKLFANRIELIFQSAIEAASNLKKINRKFDEIEPKFTVFQNDSYLMMSKNGTPMETVQRWQKAAKKMKSDGTFKKIAEKWVDYIRNTYGVKTVVKNNVLFFWKD